MTAAYFEDHPTDPEKVILRKPRLDQGEDYERGFIDGMQYQMQTSVDKAVNAMTQPTYYIPNKDERTWVGLTEEEVGDLSDFAYANDEEFVRQVEKHLKEKNNG